MYELFNINNTSEKLNSLQLTTLINSATYNISAPYTYLNHSYKVNNLLLGNGNSFLFIQSGVGVSVRRQWTYKYRTYPKKIFPLALQ